MKIYPFVMIRRSGKKTDLYRFIQLNLPFAQLVGAGIEDVENKEFASLKGKYPFMDDFIRIVHLNQQKDKIYSFIEGHHKMFEISLSAIDKHTMIVVLKHHELYTGFPLNMESETELFEKVFEHTVDAVFLMCNRVIASCNKSVIRMLGAAEKSQVMGVSPAEISPELQPCGTPSAEMAQQMMDVAREKGSHLFEWVHNRLNGEPFFAEVSLTFIPSEDNEFILAIIRDISRKKQHELTLAESEKKYRMLAENTNDVIWLMNMRMENIYISPSVEKFAGYTPEDYYKLPLEKRLTKASQKKMKDLFEVGLKYAEEDLNLHTFSTEMQYIHKNGEVFWGQSNISLIRDENNKIVEILGVTRNIDARKKMEHELMLEKERLRAMIEAFDGYIYICSPDFVIEFMNEKLVERTGYDGTGKKCYEVLHDREDKCEWCVNDRIQAGESVHWEVLSPKDNRWYSVSNTPIFNPDGTISKQAMIHDITDAKLAQIELKEKEQKFRFLIELAVDGIVIGDSDGVVTDVNAKFLEMTMRSREDIIGRHISVLFAGEELNQKPLRFDLLQEGQTVVTERTITRSDGSQLIVEMHSKRMPDGTHQAFMRDVTTRKHTEAQINEQKRFLETLIGNLPGIVYRCQNDRDWTMTFIGGRCHELTGYNPGDFIKNKIRTFNSIIHKDYQNLIWKKWQSCLKNKTNFVDEYIIQTADDIQKWVYEQGSGVYDNNGNVIALEGFIMDITDRKRAEELMIRSQFNYKMLAGHNQLLSRAALVFAMAETIEELEMMIVNYFQKLTGASMVMLMKYEAASHEFYLRQYVMSDKIKDFILNIFGEEAFAHPVTINEKIEKEMLNQGVIKAKTMKEVAFESFPSELLEELQKTAAFQEITLTVVQRQGKLMGTINAFLEEVSDVSVEIIKTFSQIAGFALSRKQTEIDLIAAKEKAEMSDRMKTVFLANISHEVKTPMNAILGFAELLEKPELDTKERLKYSEIIQKAGNQLLVIIDDLVDLAKIESGQMKIQNIKFDVIQLLQSLYEMLLPKFRNKGLGFYLKLSHHQKELLLESDLVRVRQILINLLDNAFKYTNSGEVVFGYTIDEDMMQFYVKDTGIGIHSADAMRIFERFVKLEELHSDQYGGKGLGLSISKSLAEMLGGQIHLESAVHKGSVFYLNLPLKKKK